MSQPRLVAIVGEHQEQILSEWIVNLTSVARRDLISDTEVQRQAREFIVGLVRALEAGNDDVRSAPWEEVRELLARISRSRALQGFRPTETAVFVFSLKEPIFRRIRQHAGSADAVADLTWAASTVIDDLGLFTTEVFQKNREEVIVRQQQEMLELSTPVVTLWEGVLALPLIGTLDSARTQVVMESLLQRIVDTGSLIAILDITGVPTVDTLVAQHLLKTVAAARLMGADCIISGIRPQIAQTIVHLGVDLNSVTTKATLADAFAVALQRSGRTVTKSTMAPSAHTAIENAAPKEA